MKAQFFKLALAAALGLALTFTISCSSGSDDNGGSTSSPSGGSSSSGVGNSSSGGNLGGSSSSSVGNSSSGGNLGGSSSSGGGGSLSSSIGGVSSSSVKNVVSSSSNGGGGSCTAGINGTFVDSRDNKSYKTVKICYQTWMAENLNYDVPDNDTDVCSDPANCTKYGRLYNWETAISACPSGWHLPTRDEWGELAKFAGGTGTYGTGGTAGKKLKSTSGWMDGKNGTDDYGFSALPGGIGFSDGSFIYVGDNGLWWTATESGSDKAYSRYMLFSYDYVDENTYDKGRRHSVRCVKDN